MTSRKREPIEQSDVTEFVAQASDFAFEMRILKLLTDSGFECEHGGTYNDPITSKARQFDIRARRDDGTMEPHLVVECKNIRAESPLLVHTVSRRRNEVFHDLVRRDDASIGTSVFHATGGASTYPFGQSVGKQTDQVQRRDGGSFSSSDADVFDKVQQAVSGCHGVLESIIRTGRTGCFHAVVPMLVVPDGLLWTVYYNYDGSQERPPEQASEVTLFSGQVWTIPWVYPIKFTVSHLEIVTESGLAGRLDALLGFSGLFRRAMEIANGS